jgi:dihydropteroate synthase
MITARQHAWKAPKILGVLNITGDSFSDGGKYLDGARALAHAAALVDEGADIVDIGAVASNPDAIPVSIDDEIARLDPVISTLKARGVAVSVDSFRPETQRYAIGRKVDFINDIHGFPHPEIYAEIAAAQCRLILMHSIHRTGHVTRNDIPVADIVACIIGFFRDRLNTLEHAGIDRSRVILDPGMGYFLGVNPGASFAALAAIGTLRANFDLPVLVGVSRKSFLRAVTGRASPTESGAATLAAEVYAAIAGADYIRTHDVAALRDGLLVLQAIDAPMA